MDGRSLLEAAAKAAGITVLRSRLDDPMWHDLLLDMRPAFPQTAGWNPLTDDGDALRLAVKLRIPLDFDRGGAPRVLGVLETSGDAYAATRRAIVCAAAAMVQP